MTSFPAPEAGVLDAAARLLPAVRAEEEDDGVEAEAVERIVTTAAEVDEVAVEEATVLVLGRMEEVEEMMEEEVLVIMEEEADEDTVEEETRVEVSVEEARVELLDDETELSAVLLEAGAEVVVVTLWRVPGCVSLAEVCERLGRGNRDSRLGGDGGTERSDGLAVGRRAGSMGRGGSSLACRMTRSQFSRAQRRGGQRARGTHSAGKSTIGHRQCTHQEAAQSSRPRTSRSPRRNCGFGEGGWALRHRPSGRCTHFPGSFQ